jgi:hypothetical protein
MNFFSNLVAPKNYLKMINSIGLKNENFFFVKNFAAIAGNQSLFKYFKIFEIIISISKLKGDIIELGVWRGNNLIFIKKVIDYFNLKKKIFGYDWFKGLKEFGKNDIRLNKKKYKGNKNFINELIEKQKLKKIYLIDDDVKNFKSHFDKKQKFCLVYLDLDLYEPTKKVLDIIDKYMVKNGLIVFDQAQKKEWVGEKKALNEFCMKNKNKYRIMKLKKHFSPDIILTKI